MLKAERIERMNALRDALMIAKAEVYKLRDTEDDGTCNFDSPAINLDKMKEIYGLTKKSVEEAIQSAGLRCFEWTAWKEHYLIISGLTRGQANCRTVMAERAEQVLRAAGYPTAMYYQMD